MTRHAYLIAGHDNPYVLSTLVEMLDDPRNDLFVHVDKKSKGFDAAQITGLSHHSKVYLAPRMRVFWGDYSQVKSVLRLVKTALGGPYSYFHVLSGADLPLKSNDYIHDFFDANAGKEFVAFNKPPKWTREWLSHVHPFNKLAKSPHTHVRALHSRFNRGSIRLQQAVGVDRLKRLGVETKYGSDWFSISRDLASHLVANERLIAKWFRWSFNPVEYYLQTLVWNSSFRGRVFDLDHPYRSSMRLIDFPRGSGSSPHTWTMADLDELATTDRLFARKFSEHVDREIIDVVKASVQSGTWPTRASTTDTNSGPVPGWTRKEWH